MTTSTDIHVGDVGTIFLLNIVDDNVAVDLSGGVSGSNIVLFKKPDGTSIQRQATFNSDGTDGRIKYTSVSGDLDQPGTWYISANVNTLGGKWTATALPFTVRATFTP